MGEVLLGYPVVPFLVGAVGVALLGRRVGAIIMVLAPLVALAQMVALEPGALAVTVDYHDFPLDPIRVDRLSLAFGYVFAAARVAAALSSTPTTMMFDIRFLLRLGAACVGDR